MLTLAAPAKLNLTLEVLGKRPDGFHEIRSVIQTVDLCDELSFQTAPETVYRADMPDWTSEKSLVPKAVDLVREKTDNGSGVRIGVKKRIPLVSGLGGDSSDAAAVLKGLNILWSLNLTTGTLLEMAAQLGSDVPFFIYGGTALMEGRGERITPLPPLFPTRAVLAIPDVPAMPQKTARLYGSLRENHYTDGSYTERLVRSITELRELDPDLLFNTFENVAFDPSGAVYGNLGVYRHHILKIGAPDLHLAGSGPSLFSVVKDRAAGEDLIARLKGQGLSVYLVKTTGQ